MSPKKRSTASLRHLIGSNWSAAAPVDRDKHFRVVGVRKTEDGGEPVELVELEAVLSRRRVEVRREDLDDPTKWLTDWR